MKDDLHGSLRIVPYITQDTHRYLAEDAWRPEGPNIGLDGEHLTICLLSLNRSNLSIRLLSSVAEHLPSFRGEVLIVDNGSVEIELEKLRAALAEFPFRSRIECLNQNYGVSGGRNRAMDFVKTPWVMSLDNDLYFVANPLRSIQADIAQLGCHFLTLPLFDSDEKTISARGGSLWLQLHKGELLLGGGSSLVSHAPSENREGYLSTCLSGGAVVFRADTFKNLGGYDEGMFVGFEDTEFSLRVFRAGLKIGSSDCLALVHDHPKPDSDDDKNYEKARFARDRLVKSARYFEGKHGYKIWNDGVEDWLTRRVAELDIASAHIRNAASSGSSVSKPRIALIVDRPDWALANIARQIEAHLSDQYEFEVLTSMDSQDRPEMLAYLTRDHDLRHYFWREPLHHLYSNGWRKTPIDRLFGGWDNFSRTCLSRPITCGVYDHLFLSPENIRARLPMFRDILSGYTVSSKKLLNIYEDIAEYPKPLLETPDGVSTKLFRPSDLGRLESIGSRPLRVGWVGNSRWGSDKMDDPKGFHGIVVPALARLAEMGVAVEPVIADRQVQHIPHAQMPAYYSTIDVLLCSSLVEGTPNPVLEAMACGVPVISTDVGIVPEAFGPIQRRFILAERSVEALTAAISDIARDPAQALSLSSENLSSIAGWDWSIRVEAFRAFFSSVLEKQSSLKAAV